MLDNNKKTILDNNYLLNKRKDAHRKSIFKAIKNRCFLLGIFFGLVVVVVSYFLSPVSNVYRIKVVGNVYLNDEDIVEISGLSTDSKYLTVIPNSIEKKLNKSVYIDNATVTKISNRVIKIKVEEVKQVAYIYENGESDILLINGEKVKIDETNDYMICKIPLLEGYTESQREDIIRGFKQIDYQTINEISEIHRYPFSYDENMMEVIMKDGNYCFLSWTGLSMLDNYYSIVSGIDQSAGKVCIYLNELTNAGYTSVCPWQEGYRVSASESTSGQEDS